MGNRCHRADQPSSTKGHWFILAIIDYFSKWAEATLLVELKTSNVVNFIKHHVIHQFCVPRRIIHDNGLVSQVFYRFCDKYRIQNMASTAYNPAANGLAEAFNKIIIKLIKKFVSSNKRTGMRSLVNVFGPTELRFAPRQAIRLFFGIRVRSNHTVRNPDTIITSRLNGQNDNGRQ